jgi:hypothetical protein
MAIALFVLSAFFYSFQAVSEGLTSSLGFTSHPYRFHALMLVGSGLGLMFVASISYTKRSKNLGNTSYRL